MQKHVAQNEYISITGEWTITTTTINPTTGLPINRSRKKLKNRITNGGLANMAALLIGEYPSETGSMHIVIGSNAIPAQDNDTITSMGEVLRKPIVSKSRTGSTARLRAFLLNTEGNGDHKCLGVVARSTDVAGTGELINRLAQQFSKASNQVLTIECKIIFQRVVGG